MAGSNGSAVRSRTASPHREKPGGAINGANITFLLAYAPKASTENLYLNGQHIINGDDYTLTGKTITMGSAPFAGDVLYAVYQR